VSENEFTTARLLGEITGTLKSVSSDIADIKASLDDGNKKFEAHGKQLQEITLECAKRGVNCPSIHGAYAQAPAGSVPWRYIGAGLAFIAASLYGLVVIVAKVFKIDLPWPF
jgi:hypothetical protein